MHNNETFCVLPFIHTVLNPYDSVSQKTNALPCCRYSHTGTERYESMDPINKSMTWIKLQEQVLNGEKPIECSHCWRDEHQGIPSYRMSMLEEFDDLVTTKQYREKKLLFLELMFSNTCNLTCRMCGSTFSSKWNALNEYLGSLGLEDVTTNTPNITFSDWGKLDLSHLTKLKIMGGEPFYQKGALSLLTHLSDTGVLKNISLTIPTNCTVGLTERWMELLTEAKSASIILSVDAIGPLNDYIREGSIWSDVESNIYEFHEFASTFSKKVKLQFNSVATAYNVNVLNEIQNYFSKRFQWHHYIDIAYYPAVLDISLLPDHIKEKLIQKKLPEKILEYMNSKRYSTDNFNKLKYFTNALDEYHSKNLKDYNSEMYEWIFDEK